MSSLLPRAVQLGLDTKQGNPIENELSGRAPRAGEINESRNYETKYPDARHRPGGPSPKYNCHGLSFASRRTAIWKAEEIAKILSEDEYEIVEERILPGDIVIYINGGDIEHSGIVVSSGSVPMVLSKWGYCHEVIHNVNDCPYGGQIRYYRIKA